MKQPVFGSLFCIFTVYFYFLVGTTARCSPAYLSKNISNSYLYIDFTNRTDSIITHNGQDSTEQNDTNEFIHMALGYGWSSISGAAFAAAASLSYQVNYSVFTARYIWNDGINGSGGPDAVCNDIGILYGYGFNNFRGHISLSAGLEYVNTSLPKYNLNDVTLNPNLDRNITVNSWTIGFPIELQILGPFSRNIGGGIIFFADINKIDTHVGFILCFQFGKLY